MLLKEKRSFFERYVTVDALNINDFTDLDVDNIYYFSYGSNLNMAEMSHRCPLATVVGAGVIGGYTLTFGQGGFATIVKANEGVVYGGIWHVSLSDCASLDGYEGYPRLYDRFKVQAVTDTGDIYTVFTYAMPNPIASVPSSSYVKRCLEGYNDFGMSADYFTKAVASVTSLRY